VSIRSSTDMFNGLMSGGAPRGGNPKVGNAAHWGGNGVPQHDAFAAFLPDLDGDDPTTGLDIFSTSESGCSLDYMDAVRTDPHWPPAHSPIDPSHTTHPPYRLSAASQPSSRPTTYLAPARQSARMRSSLRHNRSLPRPRGFSSVSTVEREPPPPYGRGGRGRWGVAARLS